MLIFIFIYTNIVRSSILFIKLTLCYGNERDSCVSDFLWLCPILRLRSRAGAVPIFCFFSIEQDPFMRAHFVAKPTDLLKVSHECSLIRSLLNCLSVNCLTEREDSIIGSLQPGC